MTPTQLREQIKLILTHEHTVNKTHYDEDSLTADSMQVMCEALGEIVGELAPNGSLLFEGRALCDRAIEATALVVYIKKFPDSEVMIIEP